MATRSSAMAQLSREKIPDQTMNRKYIILLILGLGLLTTLLLWRRPRSNTVVSADEKMAEPDSPAAAVTPAASNATVSRPHRQKLKHRFSEFSEDEKSQFYANFAKRYKPA